MGSNSSGPAPSSGRRWGRRRTHSGGAGMWAPVEEAAGEVAARYSPEAALDAVRMLDGMPGAVAALGQAFTPVGQTSADEVAFDPRAAQVYQTLGEVLTRAAPAIADAAAAVRRIEDERIRRAEEGDDREAKWDVDRNRGR